MSIQIINFETIQDIWYEEDMWGQLAFAHPVSTMLYLEDYNQDIKNLSYSKPVFYVYMLNNEIAGVNSYHKVNDKQCRSRGLYVFPKYRKLSIGVELLRYAINQNKDMGYEFIWSMPRSTAARTYQKAGFVITTDVFSELSDGQKTMYKNHFCRYDYEGCDHRT